MRARVEALDVQLGHCMFHSDMRAVVAVLPGDGIGPEVVAQGTEAGGHTGRISTLPRAEGLILRWMYWMLVVLPQSPQP